MQRFGVFGGSKEVGGSRGLEVWGVWERGDWVFEGLDEVGGSSGGRSLGGRDFKGLGEGGWGVWDVQGGAVFGGLGSWGRVIGGGWGYS